MTRWERAPDVLWRSVPGCLLLCRPGEGEVVEVTGPGPELWALVVHPVDEARLVASLVERFGADPGRVRDDITPVLADLERRGLLVAHA